jgi:hypothetical protein
VVRDGADFLDACLLERRAVGSACAGLHSRESATGARTECIRSSVGSCARFIVEDLGALLGWDARRALLVARAAGWMRNYRGEAFAGVACLSQGRHLDSLHGAG